MTISERRAQLVHEISELDKALRVNGENVGALGVGRSASIDQARPELERLGRERGELLTRWNQALAEHAALA
jgi:hypothetical protein